MNLHHPKLFKTLFVLALSITLVGACSFIIHVTWASLVLTIGLVASLLSYGIALFNILNSKKILGQEKFLWTIFFLSTGFLAGFAYLFVGQKRI